MAEEDRIVEGLIWINPERVSGTPCFLGTRVPIENLFDNLEVGETVEQFASVYGIPLEQVLGVLELARKGVLKSLEAA